MYLWALLEVTQQARIYLSVLSIFNLGDARISRFYRVLQKNLFDEARKATKDD